VSSIKTSKQIQIQIYTQPFFGQTEFAKINIAMYKEHGYKRYDADILFAEIVKLVEDTRTE
jgi:hypothetical protein